MKITVVGAFAMTEALRWPCESAPSSPSTSPGPSSVTRDPSRTTSSAPSRIAKNSNANRPSCSSCSPGATSISSAQSATRRNSCLSRSAKTGIDLSRAGFNVTRSSHSTSRTRARTLALVQARFVLAGCGRSARAARAAVALEDVERLVQVDLDLAAVGLRDCHLVAVVAEIARDVAGRAATADALLSGRLRLGRSVARDRLLRILVGSGAVPGPAGAATAAVALEDVERLVQVDLDLAAVGLRDRHLVAVAAEIGGDIAGRAAAADALLSSRLRLGRGVAGHRLLRVLVRPAAVRGEGGRRLGSRAALRRGRRRIGGAGNRRAAECKRAESPDAEHRL